MIRTGMPLALDDIQGNVMRAYAFPAAGYLFVRLDAADAGRRWLADLVEEVTTAEEWPGAKPASTFNLAVTYSGLDALGVPAALLRTFPEPFRQGMAARATALGDVGASEPNNWEEGLGTGDAHVLALVHARGADVLEQRMAALLVRIEEAPGLAVVHQQRAELLPFGREHFGFSDGFSQPDVQYSGADTVRGQGTPGRFWGWRTVRVGEFILGYEDEDDMLPDAPAPPFSENGTYMIYRKLRQDVALFRRFLREVGKQYPGGEEMLAAKVVGRWRDGTPLVLSPDGPDPSISGNKARINDFRYDRDPDGYRCPLGAHVRRANPRDALGWGGVRTKRHRIIRRGLPYGPPLPEGQDDDDLDRGLIFVGLNASLERQFETIQSQWLNDGNIFSLGSDRDFLVGTGGAGKMTIQGASPFFLSPELPLVTTRGGEYLFLPSMNGLRALAGDNWEWI